MHNERSPSPGPPSLDAIPKFMFNRFASVGEAKHTFLEIEAGAMQALHSLTATTLCQIDHMNAASILDLSGSHNCDQ